MKREENQFCLNHAASKRQFFISSRILLSVILAVCSSAHLAAGAAERIDYYVDSGYFNLSVESKSRTFYQLETSADLKTWSSFYNPFLGADGSSFSCGVEMSLGSSFFRFRTEDVPFDVESGFLTMSDGARMYRTVGGSGPVIVFIHGGTQISDDWLAQLVFFGKTNRVAIYDLRGFYRSEVGNPESSPWNWSWSKTNRATVDLSELINSMTNGPVKICGLSMGSAIAAQYAVMYPSRVSKLILASPWAGNTFPRDAQIQNLNALTNKTLVLVGSEDTWGSKEEVEWAQTQGYTAQVITVAGADHTINTSRTADFNTLVDAFFADPVGLERPDPPLTMKSLRAGQR
jgi:pimeloyl-ACP methyl ester carboxylesterase